jgi:peptidoglycan/xylan/chitin deacetylase (PgdA/CDA1 family)
MTGAEIGAALSLDLDDGWASLKTHGDPEWRECPSFLEIVVPRALDFFSTRGQRATLFVVGKDAAEPRHRDLWRAVAASPHEIANHSFDHEPWFHLYSRAQVREQIASAEFAIESATGRRPEGNGSGGSAADGAMR